MLIAVIAADAGCVAKSDSSGPDGLGTGAYVYSGSALPLNECNLVDGNAAAFDGVSQDLTVSGATITFDVATDPIVVTSAGTMSFDATIAGNSFTAATLSREIDWTTTASQMASGLTPLSQGYACDESDTYDVRGTITGANQFHRETDVHYLLVSGTASECIAANNSAFSFAIAIFPCESRLTQDASP